MGERPKSGGAELCRPSPNWALETHHLRQLIQFAATQGTAARSGCAASPIKDYVGTEVHCGARYAHRSSKRTTTHINTAGWRLGCRR